MEWFKNVQYIKTLRLFKSLSRIIAHRSHVICVYHHNMPQNLFGYPCPSVNLRQITLRCKTFYSLFIFAHCDRYIYIRLSMYLICDSVGSVNILDGN